MVSPLRLMRVAVSFLLALTSLTFASHAQNVTTWHNDNSRTGWQQTETILTPSTVNQSTFGLLWQWGSPSAPLTGQIFAQPLAVSGVQTNIQSCQPCDLVFVATEQNMLYAFNATSSSQNPVWSLSLGTPVDCTNPPANFMICNDKGRLDCRPVHWRYRNTSDRCQLQHAVCRGSGGGSNGLSAAAPSLLHPFRSRHHDRNGNSLDDHKRIGSRPGSPKAMRNLYRPRYGDL